MPLSANLRGALFMALSMAGFTFNDTIAKFLTESLNVGQVIFMRGIAATLFVSIFAAWRGELRPLRMAADPLLLLRIVCEVCGTLTFLTAIVHIQIANASAVLQAMPLAVTVGAALFFGEPVGWRRWSAIIVGFIGVMIVVRPGVEGFSSYSMWVVATVFFSAMRDLVTRKVNPAIPPLFISLLTAPAVGLSGLLLIESNGGWQPVTLCEILLVMAAAGVLLVGYHFIIKAMRTGAISFIAPFRYTSLLWAITLGVIVFGDFPDLFTIAGSVIVVGSGLYTLYRERRVAPEPIATEVTAGKSL